MRLTIKNCAELAADSYSISKDLAEGKSHSGIRAFQDISGAQALVTKDNVLVIPGTNELADWLKNFDVFNILGGKYSARESSRAGSGAYFHAGFWRHSMQIHGFARSNNIEFIVGHSLGAATAQILGAALNVPAVGFASPRVKRGPTRIRNENRVLNICRADDLVTRVPPSEAGFRRLGNTIRLMPPTLNKGMDHSMQEYIAGLSFDAFDGELPIKWG